MPLTRRHAARLLAGAGLAGLALRPAEAATRAEIVAGVNAALQRLQSMPNAQPLLRRAVAVLVFPRILSGGFIVGGQYGEGALVQGGEILGFYRIVGASFGLTAGAQTAGLAMFFMTDEALARLRSGTWELGTDPSVVVLDAGLQANITSTTLSAPVYAVSFNQQGLMASLSIRGTRIEPFAPEG